MVVPKHRKNIERIRSWMLVEACIRAAKGSRMMKTSLKTFAAVSAVVLSAAAAPAFASSQLVANAGLTPAEAEGLTLNQIAQFKFSRNAGNDERQVVVRIPGTGGDSSQLAASAGLGPDEAAGLSLNEIAIAKFNRNVDNEDRQWPGPRSGVTAMSRSMGGAAWAQLAANAGLTPEEAAGMTLTEIAIAKFNRNADNNNRQGAY
jgi:hypothetical protein